MNDAPGAMVLGMPLYRAATPLLVLLILAMMVLPLPPFLLDALFTLNLALAMIVLMTALNARRPLDFSVFPTVLLLTTLLRLSLNVASTRLILMQGHTGPDAAGQVIQSFGHFLVGGNAAVGFIVFLILVVINFVVITKGAGRIAEVAARFTLDSMPGKQLAVDADLQAGFIDEVAARHRRADIGREADFYGAMDGASKFVRGDAIAGIVILLVNLIGGVAVGLLQHDLGFSEALARYALLTVGDGLVTQIPALVISTAAGIVVSRASAEQDLAREFTGQVFGQPRLLLVAAAVLAALGAIPGTPHLAFLGIAVLLALAVWAGLRRRRGASMSVSAAPVPGPAVAVDGATVAPAGELSWNDLPVLDTLALEVGYRLIPLIDSEQGGDCLARISEARRAYADEMGVIPPPARLRDNLELRPNAYRVLLKGAVVAHGELPVGQILAVDDGEVFGRLDGPPGVDPLTGEGGVWLDDGRREHAELRGYRVLEPAAVLARAVEASFRANAAELFGRGETQALLDALAQQRPGLGEAVSQQLSLVGVQAVLQGLIAEGVSIRDSQSLFEALAARAPQTHDAGALIEHARAALGRHLIEACCGDTGVIQAMTLAPTLEARLADELREGQALAPDTREMLVDAARRSLAEHADAGHPPVLLTTPGVRAAVARCLRRVLPGLAVLSYAEIPDDRDVQAATQLDLMEWLT